MTARAAALLALAATIGGCDGAPLIERTVEFAESADPLPSPGRGFLRYAPLADGDDLGWVRAGGDTLIYSPIRLDPGRDVLPDGLEAALRHGLERARDAGLMAVVRAVYNDGPGDDGRAIDAPLPRIRAHIAALAPIIGEHADVVLAVEAGLIGAWGEWHGSASEHGAEARRTIVEDWLAALPARIPVLVRTPGFKVELTGVEAPGDPDVARIGHHNDCFLSSPTDVGTYPEGQLARWLDWLEVDTAGSPFGGETCALDPRNTCPAALAEMARLRVDFLNRGWHPDVIERWQVDGCLDEIERRLGHRLVLDRAVWPAEVERGAALPLTIDLRNVGFAPPRLPWRLGLFALDGDGAVVGRWPVAVDPRRWQPGVHRVGAAPVIDLAPGAYALELGAWHSGDAIDGIPDGMPDAIPMPSTPLAAMRFANDGIWQPETGRHRLGGFVVR